jgi:hypothetical protein
MIPTASSHQYWVTEIGKDSNCGIFVSNVQVLAILLGQERDQP